MNEFSSKEWNDNSVVVPLYEMEKFQSHGNILKVIVPTTLTANQFGLYEIEMEANARGPKLHYHKQMDETFIIHEGFLTVLTAEEELTVGPGTVVHIPRLSVHGYNNNSDGIVKMTMIFNPGLDREDFFRKMYQMLDESPNDTEKFLKLYADYDSYPINDNDMIPMRG